MVVEGDEDPGGNPDGHDHRDPFKLNNGLGAHPPRCEILAYRRMVNRSAILATSSWLDLTKRQDSYPDLARDIIKETPNSAMVARLFVFSVPILNVRFFRQDDQVLQGT